MTWPCVTCCPAGRVRLVLRLACGHLCGPVQRVLPCPGGPRLQPAPIQVGWPGAAGDSDMAAAAAAVAVGDSGSSSSSSSSGNMCVYDDGDSGIKRRQEGGGAYL